MPNIVGYIFCGLLVSWAHPAFAEVGLNDVTILITSFDHFQDPINSGAIIASALEKSPTLKAENIKLIHCKNLSTDDTTGKNAFSRTQQCLRTLKKNPDLVISLGESDCNLMKLETRLTNVIHLGSPLDANAGPELPATLPMPEMYCAGKLAQEAAKSKSKPLTVRIRPSQDAGSITCNNSAFFTAQALKKSDIPYGFLHVPRFSKTCHLNETSKKESIAVVEAMLISAAKGITTRKTLGTTAENTQPKNHSEVAQIIAANRGKNLKACEHEFYSELLKDYAAPTPSLSGSQPKRIDR